MSRFLTAFAMTFSVSAFAAPVVFQEVLEIVELFEQPEVFCKSTPTLGRLPSPDMIGKTFPTYVSDGQGGTLLETMNTVTDDVMIARMPEPIVGDTYNEWLVSKEYWKIVYGEVPESTDIKAYYRQKPIEGVEVTGEVLDLLGSKNGKTVVIMIPWDSKGMVAYKGGYLAEFEYAIAPEEMKAHYKKVDKGTIICTKP